eukprot:scaffold108665_cov34-Prasinocladus_malaysianus.AAC.2
MSFKAAFGAYKGLSTRCVLVTDRRALVQPREGLWIHRPDGELAGKLPASHGGHEGQGSTYILPLGCVTQGEASPRLMNSVKIMR